MSQVASIDAASNNPHIPTQFDTNSGNAIPIANILNILGAVVVAGSNPFRTIGSGNTVTAQVQMSQAIAATDATKLGLASFSSAHFGVDANGFVTLNNPFVGLTITGDTGPAISPSSNNWNLKGTVISGSGIEVDGSGSTLSVRMAPNYNLSDFAFQNTAVATPRTLEINNQDTNSTSSAILRCAVVGASSADPYLQVGINSVMNYCWGIDNSDSQSLKIAANANASTATPSGGTILWKMTSAGVMTLPQAPLGETSGGTNQSNYTTGDLLYASAANTLSKRAIGSTGQVLVVSGGIPTWSTATFPITVSQGDILYGSASNTLTTLAKDTNATRYLSNTGTTNNPAWAQVALGTGVSGQLPLANGGTNANLTASNGGIFYSTGSAGAILAGTATAGQILQSGSTAPPTWSTATYPATAGSAGKVLISDGTNIISSTPTFPNASATTGKIIISDGTNWVASAPTQPNSYAQGDVIYASASNTLTALAKNTSSTRYLSNTGTSNNPAWAQVALSTGVSDYAEGTFTPTLSFGGASVGITYTSNIGYYRKIGSMIYIWGRIFLSNKGSSTGGSLISGLPFTNNTGSDPRITISMNQGLTLGAGNTVPIGKVIFSTTTMQIYAQGSGTAETLLTDTAFTNTTDINFNGAYIT